MPACSPFSAAGSQSFVPLSKQRDKRQRKKPQHIYIVGALPCPLSHRPHSSQCMHNPEMDLGHPLTQAQNLKNTVGPRACFWQIKIADGLTARRGSLHVGLTADRTRSMSNLPHAHRMWSRAPFLLPRSWWLSRPRFPSQNRSSAHWGLCEGAGGASLVLGARHGSGLWAHGASAVFHCPVCHSRSP